jgi:SAM-dependent methyltransferase
MPRYYKGIEEKTGVDIHEEAFNVLSRFLSPHTDVLDLGCGDGAFSQRLVDGGNRVLSCDVDISQKKSNSVGIKLDLNKTYKHWGKWDCVVAIELIEHLENPWKFMRELPLKKDGLVLLTTPNVSRYTSRLRFFMRGTLLGFEKEDLSYGHITPITSFHLENIFEKTGYDVLLKKTVGFIPFFEFPTLSRFFLVRNLILPFLRPFMSGEKDGDCLMYVLRKR